METKALTQESPLRFGKLITGVIAICASATIIVLAVGAVVRAGAYGFWFLVAAITVLSFAAYWLLLGHVANRIRAPIRAMFALALSVLTYLTAITVAFVIATLVHGA